MRKVFYSVVLTVIFIAILMPASILMAAEALPAGPFLQSNQKAAIGGWEIQVSNGIKWTKEIKNTSATQSGGASNQTGNQSGNSANKQAQTSSKKSQDGMTFALIPVTIKNVSSKTSSLLLGVWNFYDYTGKAYLMLTLGIDFLPTEDQLNMKEFKPGESRKGYLPFELPDGLDKKDKYIQLIIPLIGSATWKL